MNLVLAAFLGCQLFVVLFIALHDWIPLGKLTHLPGIRAADTRGRLLLVTGISALPFAVGFAASAHYAAAGLPMWLMWWLWISYATGVYGMLRAWWVPYLLIEDRARATRYQERFAHTHAFLPIRNGIRPDTLHVCFHAVLVTSLILLAVLTFHYHVFSIV